MVFFREFIELMKHTNTHTKYIDSHNSWLVGAQAFQSVLLLCLPIVTHIYIHTLCRTTNINIYESVEWQRSVLYAIWRYGIAASFRLENKRIRDACNRNIERLIINWCVSVSMYECACMCYRAIDMDGADQYGDKWSTVKPSGRLYQL